MIPFRLMLVDFGQHRMGLDQVRDFLRRLVEIRFILERAMRGANPPWRRFYGFLPFAF